MASQSHHVGNLVDNDNKDSSEALWLMLVDDFKDSFDASDNKERNPNSDDEVDMYSDIEFVNNTETQMDDGMEDHLEPYKWEESQINNNDDGFDSSENELVIDKDACSDEENEKLKDDCADDSISESNQPYLGHHSEMQNEHSVEQKEASEPGDVEHLENSTHSVESETKSPDGFQDQCYDDSDLSCHQFKEATQSEENKENINEHLDSKNSNDLGERDEREIMTGKVVDNYSVDSHNTDLGVENISDTVSDYLNQSEGAADIDAMNRKEHCDISQKLAEIDDAEKTVARLLEQDSYSCSQHKSRAKSSYSKRTIEETGKYNSGSKHSSQSQGEAQEKGEIIEDPLVQKNVKKHVHKCDYRHSDIDNYIGRTPRISISDLPRIPKIKRDRSETDDPEEIPFKMKRTSVLGRVDVGSSDIRWKILSKYSRECSYRDGRPEDERLLYRERETQSKGKKSGNEDRLAEEKGRDSDRRRDDSKKEAGE